MLPSSKRRMIEKAKKYILFQEKLLKNKQKQLKITEENKSKLKKFENLMFNN